jgi:hypothetical protein
MLVVAGGDDRAPALVDRPGAPATSEAVPGR